MVDIVLDLSQSFVSGASSSYTIDMGGWDYAIVQLVNPSGAVNFTSSNDGGDISSYENAVSALNFTAVQGTNLATGTAVTSLNASGLVKFNVVGKFLKLAGSSVTADKVLVRLAKIH